MIRYTIKRLLYLIPILFGVTFLTFLMLYLAPSDPISMKYSSMATVGDSKYIEEKKEEMGLNDSFIKQYVRWSKNVLSGDFGISTKYNVPVKDEIAKRLPKTLALTGTSILITIFLAFPLGIISAKYKNKWIDYIIRFFSFTGISIPSFWLGLMLMYIFSVKFKLLPIVGSKGIKSLILPSVTLSVWLVAVYIRIRACILEEINKDYVVALESKGISSSKIMLFHILPNSLLTIITMFGMSIGSILGGTTIIETIFEYRGLGKMAADAITNRDYFLMQGYVIWTAIIYVVINLLVDILYKSFNPDYQNYEAISQAPNSTYLMGTDYVGRDIFSRILYGGRYSLLIALLVTLLVAFMGIVIGLISGYLGGIIDIFIMRIVDMIMAFPYIVFVIAVVTIFGGGLKNLILAMTLISWTNYARVTRAMVISLKNNDFINQAKLSGASNIRIMYKYLAPNVLPYLIVLTTQDIANNLLTLSSLSLLGIGVQPPTAEWGLMLSEGKKFIQTAPWILFFPGLAIFICVVVFNLLGDSLRDILDPKK